MAACGGHCVYLPEVWGREEAGQALEALALDVAEAGGALVPHRTRKRLQVFAEGLKSSEVFPPLIGRILAAVGGLSMVDAWVNVYRDGLETTGAHQDHYNLRVPHACATLNFNLGATRHLCCEHMETGEKFYVPQENGSLFAFDAKFNAAFRHSVPPDKALGAEPESLRLSITVFAVEGPQPASVTRDAENVPPGVPLTVSWEDFDLSDRGWRPSRALPAGTGASRLLGCGPLLRGHQRGGGQPRGKGGRGRSGGYGAPLASAAVDVGAAAAAPAVPPAPAAAPRRRWARGAGAAPAPAAAAAAGGAEERRGGGLERRYDADGVAYAKTEFRRFYGGYAEWDRARPVE